MATSHLICVLDGLPVFFHGNFAQAIYLLPELRLPSRRKCERAEVVRPPLELRQLFACLDAIHFLTNRAVQFANVLDRIYFAINVAAFGLYFWHGASFGRFRAAKDHELTVQAALSQRTVGTAPLLSV